MIARWFFVLLALGLWLLWLARRGRARSGLPQGRVVYTDTGGWGRPERPLFSSQFSLTGKPDYLVTEGNSVIPIEVKSSPAPAQPYPSHVLQLRLTACWSRSVTGSGPPTASSSTPTGLSR